ncbi:LamG-like jellyroll fold domain-containing protein [Croceimicrobium hydrocarbonivorans]|uniref:T9SS type A sorting domain-containing protein n=1 Tax=Croceimicrobium hydrocarbonivorans TaxID=2761580 RepID=A0A7H0VHJ1_9FLAO|nr:LamG-like jellyroll fold domain-containing protein [Croceimicrobium hydrocarbonivorans]QNR25189.1 T9SS type A sorting domain-containing protein [Croceimicrobium hydrocarbonivorans]
MKKNLTLLLCLIGLSAFSQMPSAGLVSYYPFTTNALDQSGNNHDGNVFGASLSSDRYSRPNRAYSFNGINNHITIPYDSALKPNFPFSLSLWFKVNSFSAPSVVLYASDEKPGTYSGFWVGYHSSGAVTAAYGDGLNNNPGNRLTKVSSTIIDTSWHHVVAVFNNLNDIDVYIDCQLDNGTYNGGADTMTSGNYNSAIGRSIGHSTVTSYHDGLIDDIRLYNIALDSSDLNALCTEDPYVSAQEYLSQGIRIYPNPTESVLNIDMGGTDYTNCSLRLTDALGRIIYKNTIESSRPVLSIQELGLKGVYILSIHNPDQSLLKTERILVQ